MLAVAGMHHAARPRRGVGGRHGRDNKDCSLDEDRQGLEEPRGVPCHRSVTGGNSGQRRRTVQGPPTPQPPAFNVTELFWKSRSPSCPPSVRVPACFWL